MNVPIGLWLLAASHAATGALRAGLETGAVREDLVVPLGFGGAGLHLGVAASAPVGPGVLDLRGDLGFRLLATRYGHVAASGAHSVDARWVAPIGLGAAVVWDGRMNYLESWDDAHGYWLGAQWVGPAGRVTREIGDRELVVAAAFPLVGAVGRPPEVRFTKQDPLKRPTFWLTGPEQGERLATLATLQALRLDATLTLPAREGRAGRWVLGADARFLRTTLPTIAVDLGATGWIGRVWGSR